MAGYAKLGLLLEELTGTYASGVPLADLYGDVVLDVDVAAGLLDDQLYLIFQSLGHIQSSLKKVTSYGLTSFAFIIISKLATRNSLTRYFLRSRVIFFVYFLQSFQSNVRIFLRCGKL